MHTVVCIVVVIAAVVEVTHSCSAGKQIMKSGGLTSQERQSIVDEHNRLRQSVALGQVSSQPPAANMMEMKWDDELAARAQQWADNCMTAHDQATQRDVGRFPVGQNIAATWTTRRPTSAQDATPDFNKQIHAWFDEVRAYGYKPTGYSHGTGHYSQLVWGETSHVGCGFTFYYDPSRGYTKLYVCNYGPGGNVIGYKPYEKGQPACSSFGLSDSQKYSGLCDSYGNTINEVNYEHRNAIPESAPDAVDTSSYDAYNYKTYQTSNTYQWQTSNDGQTYEQQANPKVVVNYQSDLYKLGSDTTTTQKPATFKPFVSIFGNPVNTFGPTAQKIINNALSNTRRGFRFGTLYFK
ncbi:salivary antigen-5-like isoform X2 [Arctopsyche grandis]|uniref:salivary antigen-5-like isoform X2 n=1 Tax=Arctopsyche grandis TaxID=121162 RepID=UPI00406D7C0A